MHDDNEILVATLYKFVEVIDLNALQDQLYSICKKNEVMGTILIANEGVNGTISAKPKNLKKALISIQKDDKSYLILKLNTLLPINSPFIE